MENRDQELQHDGPPERAIVQLKLDTVQLMDFSGDLTTWEQFRDMFEYLVNKSTKLSDVVKFHQLRTHLQGEAFDTIRGYQVTTKNYKLAWTDLKNRYDNKEEIANEYIRKFLDMTAISKGPTCENLFRIVDICNQMLRALPNLGIAVEKWDPFTTLVIERKLDDDTRQKWRETRGTNYKPNIQALLSWLEERAVGLHISRIENRNRERSPKRHHVGHIQEEGSSDEEPGGNNWP